MAQPAGKLPWPRACLTRLSTLPELRAHYGERYRWLLLFLVMVGWVAAIMSSMIVNVAVHDMGRHFVVGPDRAQWVSSGQTAGRGEAGRRCTLIFLPRRVRWE